MKKDYNTKKKATIIALSLTAVCLAAGLFYYVGTLGNGELPAAPVETQPTTATSTQMKSSYGLNVNVSSQVRSTASSSDITGMQNVVSYFPEFKLRDLLAALKTAEYRLFRYL